MKEIGETVHEGLRVFHDIFNLNRKQRNMISYVLLVIINISLPLLQSLKVLIRYPWVMYIIQFLIVLSGLMKTTHHELLDELQEEEKINEEV